MFSPQAQAGMCDSFVQSLKSICLPLPLFLPHSYAEAELGLISFLAPGKMGDNAILKTFSKMLSAQMWFFRKCLYLHLQKI